MNQREISFLGIHVNHDSAARNFIIGFSVVVILAAFLAPPLSTGDGHEYALTLQAFFDHWSPDLRPEDSNKLLDLIKKYPNRGYIQELIIQIRVQCSEEIQK
jgi:hypothetical protein